MLLLFSLLFTLLAPACAAAEEKPALRVAVATDLHYISPALTDNGSGFLRVISRADGKVMRYSEELIAAFVDQMLADPPDVLLLPGDLSFNGAAQSHEDLALRLRPLMEAGVLVLAMPGNHDIAYSQAARFEGERAYRVPSPSSGEFEAIWHDFGYAQADARDAASLGYSLPIGDGWRVLIIDANQEDAPSRVKPETLAFVKDVLAKAEAAGERVISVSHQTLLRHNPMFEGGFRIANGEALREVLERGGVRLHLSGHMHIQHIARSESGLTEIVGSSLAVNPCQYGVLELTQSGAAYHTERVDVAAWAKKNGRTEEDLLGFANYALTFFASSSLRQAAPLLQDIEGGSEALLWMVNVNVGYFSGRLASLRPNDAALALLQKVAPFWSMYMKSIEPDLGKDYTQFVLEKEQ